MPLPAQIFAERSPLDLAPGTLVQVRGSWALRVTFNVSEQRQGVLVLEGPYAGKVFPIGPGVAPGVCVVPPFSWFPAVEPQAKVEVDACPPLALSLCGSGPAIGGAMTDGWGESLYFTVDGQQVDDIRANSPHFRTWTVETHHESQPYQSLVTLATIGQAPLSA